MQYDEENDRLVSDQCPLEIYPNGYNFHESTGVSVEIGDASIPVESGAIRELISGLEQAAELLDTQDASRKQGEPGIQITRDEHIARQPHPVPADRLLRALQSGSQIPPPVTRKPGAME